jgi:plasmid stabilization system protein ParE
MNKYTVVWTDNAQYDLENIVEYIKIESITNAKDIFFQRLLKP